MNSKRVLIGAFTSEMYGITKGKEYEFIYEHDTVYEVVLDNGNIGCRPKGFYRTPEEAALEAARSEAIRVMLERLADKEDMDSRNEIAQTIREFLTHNIEIEYDTAAELVSQLFREWVTNNR